MKSGTGLQFPPGFRFHPTDEELVLMYLCRKCASQPIPAPIITELDLYRYDPWDLPGTFLSNFPLESSYTITGFFKPVYRINKPNFN